MDETANDTQGRLLQVIAHADFEVLPGLYALVPLADAAKARANALACVRDGAGWSELVPASEPAPAMALRIFAFHFDPADDATGFVGWLHSHLTRTTGAGHIVVSDYWGCPADAADRVLAEVEMLRRLGARPARPHVGPGGGCLLCEVLGGLRGFPIVAETTRAVAFVNEAGPSSRGHSLCFPRRHAPRLDDLDEAEMSELFGLVRRVAKALGGEHYNVISNNGARSGQTVFHAHVHIVPKPSAGTGLIQQVGLGVVDQSGMAEELRRLL